MLLVKATVNMIDKLCAAQKFAIEERGEREVENKDPRLVFYVKKGSSEGFMRIYDSVVRIWILYG